MALDQVAVFVCMSTSHRNAAAVTTVMHAQRDIAGAGLGAGPMLTRQSTAMCAMQV